MTNESKHGDVIDVTDLQTTQLLADLQALHEVVVPEIELRAPQAPASVNGHGFVRRHVRPIGLATAAAIALAVFIVNPSPFRSDSGQVSAETILERTQGVATTNTPATSETRSYHIVAETQILGPDGLKSAAMRTETWYADEEHVRSEERNAEGEIIFGQVRNGDEFWMFGVFAGTTIPASGEGAFRAVHGPASELAAAKVPVIGGGNSLPEILAQLSAKDCFSATLTGQEAILGRAAYVIEVRPTPDTCPGLKDGRSRGEPVPVERDGKFQADALTRVWVDVGTFITLKSESYSGGVLRHRYVILELEVEPDFASDSFIYQPEPSVQVIEVTSAGDAKKALAGIKDDEKGDRKPIPVPTKTP